MSISGQHDSLRRRPIVVPRTLMVPLILFMFFIVFSLFYMLNKEWNLKFLVIYPIKVLNNSLNKTATSSVVPALIACGVPVQRGPMIKVGDHNTYVIGSYVEHRSSVKMIKTVSIVLRSQTVDYYCLMCCDGRNFTAAASYNIHSDHFDFDYGTADITCPIPEECQTPTHVAITSRVGSKDIQDIKSFQPVENQEKKDTFTYDFTVCISVMFDYKNVLQLVQAMEMFKLLGVQKVVIYKSSCYPDVQKILDYYANQSFVETIPWSIGSYITVSRGWQKSISPGELHYFGQIPALNDCLYRYMYRTRYLSLQDLDEIILPEKVDDWARLLSKLERDYSGHAGFEFEDNLFPLSFSGDERPEYEPDSWKKVSGLNILQHIHRIPNDPRKFNDYKVILNPRLVFEATVHGVLNSNGGTIMVDNTIARKYHMRNRASQDYSGKYLIKDTRLRDYASKLIPAVSKVLGEALNIY